MRAARRRPSTCRPTTQSSSIPRCPAGAEQLIDEALASIRAADGQVVVGPWLGEVGFEVLYWIPFLHWLFEQHGSRPPHVTVVSRGGAAPWYEGLGGRYVESSTTHPGGFPPADARALGADGRPPEAGRGAPVGRAGARRDPRRDLARPVHSSTRSSCTACSATSGRPRSDARLPRPRRPPAVGRARPERDRLPDEFTAVRFYFRDSFPDTPDEPRARHTRVEQLAERRPVVLLNTGVVVDEHLDAEPPSSDASSGRSPASRRHATSPPRAPSSPRTALCRHLRRARPPRAVLRRPDARLRERPARDQPRAPRARAPHRRRLRDAARGRRRCRVYELLADEAAAA